MMESIEACETGAEREVTWSDEGSSDDCRSAETGTGKTGAGAAA